MTAQALQFSRGSPISGNISSGTTNFGSDGVMGGSAYSGPANWFLPAGGQVGANYWLRITRTSGTSGVTFGALQGTWINLDTTPVLWTAVGGAGGCAGDWEISPSATGSPVVASGTISVSNAL